MDWIELDYSREKLHGIHTVHDGIEIPDFKCLKVL
jgi:hypothetical protein